MGGRGRALQQRRREEREHGGRGPLGAAGGSVGQQQRQLGEGEGLAHLLPGGRGRAQAGQEGLRSPVAAGRARPSVAPTPPAELHASLLMHANGSLTARLLLPPARPPSISLGSADITCPPAMPAPPPAPQAIFKRTPHDKQVMMFSATLSQDIRPVCKKFMRDVRAGPQLGCSLPAAPHPPTCCTAYCPYPTPPPPPPGPPAGPPSARLAAARPTGRGRPCAACAAAQQLPPAARRSTVCWPPGGRGRGGGCAVQPAAWRRSAT